MSVLRRELRRISPGARVDPSDLAEVLREDVLKREVVEGEDARAATSRAKRASTRRMLFQIVRDKEQVKLHEKR